MKKALEKPENKLQYTDGVETWTVEPGQPNHGFTIPGDPSGKQYSLKSFFDMIRRNCLEIRLVDNEKAIVDGGMATIEDLGFSPEPITAPKPRKLIKTPKGVKVVGGTATQELILKTLKSNKNKGLTKKELAEATGLRLSLVETTLAKMLDKEVTVKGKKGNSFLYGTI